MSSLGEDLLRRALAVIGCVSPRLAGRLALRQFTTPKRIPRPDWEKKLLAQGAPLRLRSGLRTTVWGKAGGKAVLLIHGWQGRGTQLALLARPLVERGFYVLALDGPAHGDSPGRQVNVGLFARAIADAVDEIGADATTVHAVGHSFGASALGLALVNGAKFRSIVLVASPSDFQKVIDLFVQRMRLSAKVKAAFEAQLQRTARLIPGQSDLGRAGAAVRAPVLVVHDPDDRQVGFANAESFAAHWPTARLLALKNVGHYKILKSPAFIQAVVEFLTSP